MGFRVARRRRRIRGRRRIVCWRMSASILSVVGIVVMIAGLASIPFGIPGIWIMMGVVGVGLAAGEVGIATAVSLLLLAVAAEIAEFVAVDRVTRHHGGSRKTFWGAILGGLVGAIVGVPLPIVGSVVGVFVGTFVGAAIFAYLETGHAPGSARVAWGATLGRATAVAIKIATGLVILAVGGTALWRG